jgi:hypothetical protein
MENEQERTIKDSGNDAESNSLISSSDKIRRNRRKIDFSNDDIEKMYEYFSQITDAPEKQRKITTKKALLESLKKTIMLLCQKNYSAIEISKMLTEKCAVHIYTKDIVPIIKEQSANDAQPVKRSRRRKNKHDLVAESESGTQLEPQLLTELQFQDPVVTQNNDDVIQNEIPDVASPIVKDSQENDSPVKKKSGSFKIEPDIEI